MIDKAAPEEYKEAAYRGYLGSFGPTGTLEVDDTENWARIVEVSKGLMARDKELNYNNINNYLMGFDVLSQIQTFRDLVKLIQQPTLMRLPEVCMNIGLN